MTPFFGRLLDALDARVEHRRVGRVASEKIFPLHWSFLLGEVALIAFLVLVVTGLFLTMFYVPSTEQTVYEGSSLLHRGRSLPAAYESVVRLSHDTDGGLFVRRLHRAASHVFVASILLHFARVVVTGAFTRPREPNYHVGLLVLLVSVATGWVGHNLPYDVISGTSLRILYSLLLSVPWIGESLAGWVFGGAFPSDQMLSRFFALHVVWFPAAIALLLVVHMVLVVTQQHTQPPEEGVDGHTTVVGEPLWPWQALTSTMLLLLVVGVLAAAAVLVPWSDVDHVGPYRIGTVLNQSQPDWYLFWVEGLIRIVPAFEVGLLGAVWSQAFVAGVVLPILFVLLLFAYPWVERLAVGEEGETHVLEHPLDVPFRAGAVAAVGAFLAVTTIAGGQDVVAKALSVPVESVTWTLRALVVALPPVAGWAMARYARSQPIRWKHRD